MNLPIPNKEKYLNSYPFPHLVIDNVFSEEQLRWVVECWPKIENKDGLLRVGITDEDLFGDYIPGFVKYNFHSQKFIGFLEELTGVNGLVLDCREIGLHETFTGGYLDTHEDYSINERTGLQHRVNAILYLNKDWKVSYGGFLELYDDKKRVAEIAPLFNRIVIFNIKDAYHGHSTPLNCPEGMSRRSIALNYFSAPQSNVVNKPTIYRKKKTWKYWAKELTPPILWKMVFAMLLISFSVSAQCPIGESWVVVPKATKTGITSGCWPDTLIGKVWKLFNIEKCIDGAEFEMGYNLLYDHEQTWDKDADTCKIKDTYQKRVKTRKKYKWVDITKKEYYRLYDFKLKEYGPTITWEISK